MIDGLILGLTLATAHVDRHYHDLTPGVYVRAANGATAGVVRDSYGRPAEYLGWSMGDRYAVTLGAIHGYPGPWARPLVVPSVRIGRVRLMLVSDHRARPAGVAAALEF